MCGALSVKSNALRVIGKRARKIKLSITLSSVDSLILPTSSVLFPLRSTSVLDVLSKTLSFHKHHKRTLGGLDQVILAVTGLYQASDDEIFGNLFGHCHVHYFCVVLQAYPAALRSSLSAVFILRHDFIYFRIYYDPVYMPNVYG